MVSKEWREKVLALHLPNWPCTCSLQMHLSKGAGGNLGLDLSKWENLEISS